MSERNFKTREGYDIWDKLCAIPKFGFLIGPTGGVVKVADIGDWIDRHEAQKVFDEAQSEVNLLRADLDALRAENERLRDECVELNARREALALRVLDAEQKRDTAMLQPVADEREAFELNAKYGEALQVLRELLDEAESIPSEIEWKALRAVGGRRVYVDDRAALSAPAIGQDVSGLVEALANLRAVMAAHDKTPEEYNALAIADAALAAHKAGGGE